MVRLAIGSAEGKNKGLEFTEAETHTMEDLPLEASPASTTLNWCVIFEVEKPSDRKWQVEVHREECMAGHKAKLHLALSKVCTCECVLLFWRYFFFWGSFAPALSCALGYRPSLNHPCALSATASSKNNSLEAIERPWRAIMTWLKF